MKNALSIAAGLAIAIVLAIGLLALSGWARLANLRRKKEDRWH